MKNEKEIIAEIVSLLKSIPSEMRIKLNSNNYFENFTLIIETDGNNTRNRMEYTGSFLLNFLTDDTSATYVSSTDNATYFTITDFENFLVTIYLSKNPPEIYMLFKSKSKIEKYFFRIKKKRVR